MTTDGLSALAFAIPEEIKEALVDALGGSEEFINPHSFASHFMRGQVRGYGVAELSGAAETFSSQQREQGLWILLPRLALLPLFNGPRGLAHIIHCFAEFPEVSRFYRARPHVMLQPN